MRLKVNKAIRMDSEDPLMDGLPVHDAAEGIACSPRAHLPVTGLMSSQGEMFGDVWIELRLLLACRGASGEYDNSAYENITRYDS